MVTKHAWVLFVALFLSWSLVGQGIQLCSRFEAHSEDWTIIAGNVTTQFPSMPKIALEVRCDLSWGICSPLGKGSVILLDGVELNQYYPDNPTHDFNNVHTLRQISYYDIFAYWVSTATADLSEFLRIDASVWFANSPFEPEKQTLPSNLQMVEEAVAAVLHFSYEKLGAGNALLAVANLNLNRLSDCISNGSFPITRFNAPTDEDMRTMLNVDQPHKTDTNTRQQIDDLNTLPLGQTQNQTQVKCEIGYYGPTCGCTIVPRLRCVDDLGVADDGLYQYRSHFTWNFACLHNAEAPEKIEISVDSLNWFWPGLEDRGQPTVFNASHQGEEFTVDWTGEVLYWTLGITSTENQFHHLCRPPKPKPNRPSIALNTRELTEWYHNIYTDRVTWLTISAGHSAEFFTTNAASISFFLDNQDVPCSNFDVIVESATPFCARVDREGIEAGKKKGEKCIDSPNEQGLYSRAFLYDLSRLPWMPDWTLSVRREQAGLIGVSLKCASASRIFSTSFVVLAVFWALWL